MSRRTVAPTRTRVARAVVNALLDHARAGATTRSMMAALEVHDERVYERVLRTGSVGLGESYADGWWDTDDLAGFLRLALRGLRPIHEWQDRFHRLATPIVDPIARLHRADPSRDVTNVRAHYDIGNEFFRHVLDDTMAYSCAVFATRDTTLAAASRAKFDHVAQMARLAPGDRLLEIGTGWGGFALHAAQRYGCRVTTTTISKEQFEFARQRVWRAGLDDQITVLDADYRELCGPFDKVVSIEMIEAVDWREYDTFFEHVRGLLTDDGMLTMQAIVVPDHSFDRLKRRTDFIKAAIFPGGCLPSVGALTAAASRHGDLALHDRVDIGLHYAETLRRWRANLEGIAPELPALGLDERFARLWRFYFAYCEAGFDERYISTAQLSYAAPGAARSLRPARPGHATRTSAAA